MYDSASLSSLSIPFAKGHGTENDFILINDSQGIFSLSPEFIAHLCHRHAGIGADGVMRAIMVKQAVEEGIVDSVPESISPDDWFMDYYNADGSVAEMCGNGARVFSHFLLREKLVSRQSFPILTRAGRRDISIESINEQGTSSIVSVSMGVPEVIGVSTCSLRGEGYSTADQSQSHGLRAAGLGIDVGNPHLACVLPHAEKEDIAALNLADGVDWDTEFFPQGVNVEFLTPLQAPDSEDSDSLPRVYMRVHERGVGETRSCGTGTVAASLAALADAGREYGVVEVYIPGGVVRVEIAESGATLTGPSEILAEGVWISPLQK